MPTVKAKDKTFNNISIVIFDKDGTLIDFTQFYKRIVFDRAKLIHDELCMVDGFRLLSIAMGWDFKNERFRLDGPVGNLNRDAIEKLLVRYLNSAGYPHEDEMVHEVFLKVDKMMANDISRYVRACPGVHILTGRLLLLGAKIGVATTDNSYRTKLVLDSLGLINDTYVVASNNVENQKPHPETIYRILNHYNIEPENAVMVGDTHLDIEMGRRAGTHTIGVCTGICKPEEMRDADIVVSTLEEVTVRA